MAEKTGLRRISSAHVMAALALFIALGGTAVALKANAVGTKQLKNNAVTTSKIKNGAVTTKKIATGAIPASLPPSGAAGGSLSGSYPNPTLGVGSVTAGKLGTITDRTATLPLNPGFSGGATATCNADEQVLTGGSQVTNTGNVFISGSRVSGNGWIAFASNTGAMAGSVTAHAYCLAP